MEIQHINASETLSLRNKILRPDLELAECSYPGDNDSSTHHLGCIHNDNLVGIVSIYERVHEELHSGSSFQIRAMATSESVRGQGIGLKLLRAAEALAFNSGAEYIWANAREVAIGFYIKSGYKIKGKAFNIPNVGSHFLVYKLSS